MKMALMEMKRMGGFGIYFRETTMGLDGWAHAWILHAREVMREREEPRREDAGLENLETVIIVWE